VTRTHAGRQVPSALADITPVRDEPTACGDTPPGPERLCAVDPWAGSHPAA